MSLNAISLSLVTLEYRCVATKLRDLLLHLPCNALNTRPLSCRPVLTNAYSPQMPDMETRTLCTSILFTHQSIFSISHLFYLFEPRKKVIFRSFDFDLRLDARWGQQANLFKINRTDCKIRYSHQKNPIIFFCGLDHAGTTLEEYTYVVRIM